MKNIISQYLPGWRMVVDGGGIDNLRIATEEKAAQEQEVKTYLAWKERMKKKGEDEIDEWSRRIVEAGKKKETRDRR